MRSDSLIEKCCLIANPAAGNPTQYLVEQAFDRNNIDWRFMTFEVEADRLGDAMRGIRALGFHGVKLGEPFQSVVAEHVDESTEAAQKSASINCITSVGEKLVGDNTVVAAFTNLLRRQFDPVGRAATIIGSGRMARVIATTLAAAGSTPLTIVSRNATNGQQLVEVIQQQSSASAAYMPLGTESNILNADTALLVNATSLGSTKPEAKLPIDVNSLGPKILVTEVAYNVGRTWLTTQAAQQGCRIIDGLSLYVEQTALALQMWTGLMPDTVAMREAAEEFLGI
ncbi:MAG TPA: shikimate dehydrogenase [Lacipirellulaceae bacterium]|nr:shikimate dehydrogenase [Lacipirellulaceae bacterium]